MDTLLYVIKVRVVPQQGTIRYMAAGPWLMFQMRNEGREPPWDHPKWLTAVPGATVELGEMTRFSARWGNEKMIGATVRTVPDAGTLVAEKHKGFRWEK